MRLAKSTPGLGSDGGRRSHLIVTFQNPALYDSRGPAQVKGHPKFRLEQEIFNTPSKTKTSAGPLKLTSSGAGVKIRDV